MAVSAPLQLGKETRVFALSPLAAGTNSKTLSMDAESVLISLYVESLAGTLDVQVLTYGGEVNSGDEIPVITFPTITSPTTGLLLRKAASILQKIIVRVTYSDACTFEIRARGVSAGTASVSIQGANTFKTTQVNVTTSAVSLLPISLTDREGILIINNNAGSGPTLYIAETLLKATSGLGIPISAGGGTISIDLAGGSEVFAVASSGTVDVRIAEAGGG